MRARLIRRLRPVEHKKDGERITIAYFLMAYAGRTTPLEKRRIRWLSFDEASEALDLGKSRRVLRSADRLIAAATGEEPRRYRVRRAAGRFAEWLVLGALALLFVAPVPPAAALLLAPPAGMLVSLAMRALLRSLDGLVRADDDVTLPPGDDRLRLLLGGAEWMTRTDYLGAPIRIAGAFAVLLPGVPASGGSWVAPAGLALAALLSWVLRRKARRQPRSTAAVLRAPALWLTLLLAAYSIATASSALALVVAFALSASSTVLWWRLERRRAGVLAAIGGK